MIISARIHPTDHMSIALEYFYEPRTISGALYHLVAIYSVFACGSSSSSLETDLANPKSAILARQSVLRRTLDGLRSN